MAKNANNYAAIICGRLNPLELKLVWFEGYENKTDVSAECEKLYPAWKVKAIHKMYDTDFVGGVSIERR